MTYCQMVAAILCLGLAPASAAVLDHTQGPFDWMGAVLDDATAAEPRARTHKGGGGALPTDKIARGAALEDLVCDRSTQAVSCVLKPAMKAARASERRPRKTHLAGYRDMGKTAQAPSVGLQIIQAGLFHNSLNHPRETPTAFLLSASVLCLTFSVLWAHRNTIFRGKPRVKKRKRLTRWPHGSSRPQLYQRPRCS